MLGNQGTIWPQWLHRMVSTVSHGLRSDWWRSKIATKAKRKVNRGKVGVRVVVTCVFMPEYITEVLRDHKVCGGIEERWYMKMVISAWLGWNGLT